MKIIIFAVCFTVLSLVDATAETKASPSENVVGLIEVPSIFGVAKNDGPPGQTLPKKDSIVKLYAKPTDRSEVSLQLTKKDEVIAREHRYEEESAVAYGHTGGWFLIKAKSGKGWLAPQDAGQFRRYEDLVEKGPSYLEKNWDGRLYQSPDDSKYLVQQKPRKKNSNNVAIAVDVRILAKRVVGDRLWFHVQLVNGRCEGEEQLGETGWVPAYSNKGETNFWFRSRGC